MGITRPFDVCYYFVKEASEYYAENGLASSNVYIPVAITFTGNYSSYTYKTNLVFAGYEAISVEGVDLNQSSIVVY